MMIMFPVYNNTILEEIPCGFLEINVFNLITYILVGDVLIILTQGYEVIKIL